MKENFWLKDKPLRREGLKDGSVRSEWGSGRLWDQVDVRSRRRLEGKNGCRGGGGGRIDGSTMWVAESVGRKAWQIYWVFFDKRPVVRKPLRIRKSLHTRLLRKIRQGRISCRPTSHRHRPYEWKIVLSDVSNRCKMRKNLQMCTGLNVCMLL